MSVSTTWLWITAVLKVKTDIIASMTPSLIGRTTILVIMSVDTSDNVCRYLQHSCYCFYQWCHNVFVVRLTDMRVTNWPNIYVDQGQFSDPDFYQWHTWKANVQFADKKITGQCDVKHIMMLRIQTITSVLKVLTYIITSIAARPMNLLLY